MKTRLTDAPSESDLRSPGLGWSLGTVLRAWSERVDAALTDCPAGGRGYVILSTVVHHPPPTQVVLASMLAIDRTVLTYLLDDLEQAKLVERQAVPGDRRARRVVATERGRVELARAEQRVADIEADVLQGLDESEQMLLRTFVFRAAKAIQAVAPGTDPCLAVEEVTRSRS